ncbi:MAG: SUMF1/EgtB/PvdO family nonheme iron enzyme [Flavobacteriales bacterium]|nr:SUMF1/EgtB/PvdO family nonheme iron enzyme [Flavobacteriales bacterium]
MSKFQVVKRLLFFLMLISIFSGCSKNLYHIIVKTNANLPGQTAPSDMVFIPGNDTVSSFYIGVSEEPNINYVLYLKWLKQVYIDYPEKVIEALPHQPNGTKTCSCNNPYITGYLTNPVYAYAPIVNLDWYQINRYLKRKTDMLNEEILIKNELLLPNPNQQNEPFNTEAHLCGQYQNGIKNYLISHNPQEAGGRWRKGVLKRKKDDYGKRCTNPNDGICFLGFRLPTESEWIYASKPAFKAEPGKTHKNFLYHDFGSDYLTFRYGRMFQTSGISYSSPLPLPINSYSVDPKFYEKIKISRSDSSIQYVRDFSSSTYGIINMQAGVKEWLLDEYSATVEYDHFIHLLRKSGFNTDSAAVIQPYQKRYKNDSGQTNYKTEYWRHNYTSKNELGQMQNFIYMGVDQNGNPNEISPLPVDSIIRTRVVRGGTNCEPSLERSSMPENEWNAQVGFRCVLMYTGAPVLKGFKVKWKKR